MDIQNIIEEHIDTAQRLKDLKSDILDICRICGEAILRGNKILLAGNGGSAADAQHIAAEFVGRYVKNRPSLPAIALTVDSSALTAISNDYGFENVYARQIEGLGIAGDVFIGLSTSGNSANIIKAIDSANKKGLKTICFLGYNGGILRGMASAEIIVPSHITARVQEMHILIGHILCQYIESQI